MKKEKKYYKSKSHASMSCSTLFHNIFFFHFKRVKNLFFLVRFMNVILLHLLCAFYYYYFDLILVSVTVRGKCVKKSCDKKYK